jgi:hypothetical protein
MTSCDAVFHLKISEGSCCGYIEGITVKLPLAAMTASQCRMRENGGLPGHVCTPNHQKTCVQLFCPTRLTGPRPSSVLETSVPLRLYHAARVIQKPISPLSLSCRMAHAANQRL